MGRKNQIYAKWIRILPNPDNEKEIYLVLEKDEAMDKKYMRQFDNMFAGKDVILTIKVLIRNKKGEKNNTNLSEGGNEEKLSESPFWSVE